MSLLATPALPLGEGGKYVAAAYLVFLALVLIYVVIMASKLSRFERELTELNEMADLDAHRSSAPGPSMEPEQEAARR